MAVRSNWIADACPDINAVAGNEPKGRRSQMPAFVGKVGATLGLAALVGLRVSAVSRAEDSGSAAAIEAPVFAPLTPTAPGSGDGLTIGYISLGESIAYIHTVTKGIEE